ncbi:MAG TPA: NYN domain-containing protein [Candidatus Polarisedimenticolia bacterium]|nr:NYN domain-containing protein [Candidatus Polarisedimenticolia bacterium]
MPYLIDGSNLLGAARDRRLGLPRDEEGLVARLASFAEARSARVVAVFDGPAEGRGPAGRASRAGRVKVFYSGSGRAADDVLVDRVRRESAPADWIVVTSDNDLRRRVRSAGGRVMGCREFSETMARALDRRSGAVEDKPLPGDVEEWEAWFRRGRGDPERE